ncbi:MAG: RHS repeat-associated core domain-containing protein [Planctomycetota bacterium]
MRFTSLLLVAAAAVALAEAPPLGQEAGLDRADAQRVDVDPTTGDLRYRHVDLTLGDGVRALEIARTYRPWSGSPRTLGVHWASVLDVHLQALEHGFAFHDARGGAWLYVPSKDPHTFVATHGRASSLTQDPDGFTLRGLGDETRYRFDRSGHLEWLERGGARHRFERDAAGTLLALRGPWGELQVERDPRGGIAALVGQGRSVRYAYDELLLTRVDVEGRVLRYGYTHDGLLKTLADGDARVLYDDLGRVIKLYGALEPTHLSYRTGPEGELEVEVTRRGQTTTVAVAADLSQVVTTPADAPLAARTERYDERGLLIEVQGPEGTERLSYDALGRLLAVEAPSGATAFAYAEDDDDRPSQVTGPAGLVREFAYDALGRLTRAAIPGAGETRYAYDGDGRLRAVKDARGEVTRFAYDERDALIAVREPGAGTTRFERDARGQVVAVLEPGERRVELTRDAWGRVTQVQDPSGTVFACSYDAQGHLRQATDELGRTTRYRYDAQGRLLGCEDAAGTLQSFSYDPHGRLAAIEDGAGATIRYSRPDARTLVVQDPVRGERTLSFDAQGRLEREVRAGVELSYRYDAVGRLIARETPAGTERFSYDAQGRLSETAGPQGGFRFAYDEAGRLASLTDATLETTLRYRYDAAGERSALILPWGEVGYERDEAGRVSAVTLPDGGRIELELDAEGRRQAIRYPNGVETRFTYSGSQLSAIETSKQDAVLDRRAYGYDAQGRVAWSEDLVGRTRYTHDARGRLLEAQGPARTVRYTYDAADTRAGGATPTLETNSQGELTRIAEVALSYDHDGHLASLKTGDEAVRYGYSPLGTRLWREQDGVKSFFLSDLGDVVATTDAEGRPQTTFVHGPDEDDVLSAQRGGESFFYHYDLVRSVTAITDAEGQVAASYRYGAFGEALASEGPAAEWNPFRYTSREAEAAGLYHYRARTYSPELGQFTSPDPLGVFGGVNPYAYVDNDPTLFNDPTGLEKRPWWKRAWDATTSAVKSTVEFAKAAGTALVEDIKEGNLGRNVVAFGKGLGKGLWSGAKGLYTLVRHPVQTVSAIAFAVGDLMENGRNGVVYKALAAKVEEYKNAALNDPERFWEMTGELTGEIAFSVVGTKGLDKVAKLAPTVAAATWVAPTVNRVVQPVVNANPPRGQRRIALRARAAGARNVERGVRLSRAPGRARPPGADPGGGRTAEAAACGSPRGLEQRILTRTTRRVGNAVRDTRRYAAMAPLARRDPGLPATGRLAAPGASWPVPAAGCGSITKRYDPARSPSRTRSPTRSTAGRPRRTRSAS